jgi:rifampicin phosphotransferase
VSAEVADRTLLDLEAALAADESQVGGKAAGLARLARAGVPVPWWIVVPARAFEQHVARAGLARPLRERLGELRPGDARERVEAIARELGGAIEAAPLDAALVEELRGALEGRGALAVRSSVVGEDAATGSFAGLFDSHLFVDGAERVADAVRRCWASAVSARALAYRLARGERVEPAAVGVVIQDAVEGEASGVLFTRNPLSGRLDEALVSACWGLGEGVVGGRCDVDEYVWTPRAGERSATVADKELRVVRDPAGGTTTAAVAAERRSARVLEPQAVEELCRAGLRVAEALGRPQDIEWTRAGGRFLFLQARPITSLPAGTPVVWDNSNIQESFNGVTTPLTFSIAVRGYASVYRQTLALLGVSEQVLDDYRTVLRNMIGLVRGRVYYNINNWYRCLLLLPSFDRNKEDMEQMMGLDEPVDFVEGVELSAAGKLRRLPSLARVGVRLAREFRRLDRSVERFLSASSAYLEAIDRDRLRDADLGELLAVAERLERDVLGDWTTPIVNDIYVSTTSGRLRRAVAELVGADAAPEVAAGLLSGEEQIESREPTHRLLEIAELIRADRALTGALERDPPRAAMSALRDASPALRDRLDAFLDRYGDRCIGEMKLETPSLRHDPSFVVGVLRNFVAAPDLDLAALRAREREQGMRFERLTARRGRRQRRLRRALRRARRGVRARENMRFVRTRVFGVFRDVYVAAGHRLHETGALERADDVFYLTADELTAYHEGTAVTARLADLVRVRRAEFAAYQREQVPNRFETLGSVYASSLNAPPRAADPDARLLQGTGCCPGVVEADVRVILSPDDDLSVNGRILTTVRTDPGWTPLFPSVAGLLIERGSTLSHSAVIAREFGIPAVVGVPNLLDRVRDGERVRLDGGTGTVERLDQPTTSST